MANDGITAPIRDDVLQLPDGRRLAWAEWGRSDGPAAVLLHTSPGSRLLDPDPAATAAAGIRLLTVDRPGFGGSDPVADPSLAGFGADVAALADALEVRRIALLGWSGGGSVRSRRRRPRPRRPGRVPLAAGQPGARRRVAVGDGRVPGLAAGRARRPGGALPAIAEAFKGLGAQSGAILNGWKGPAEAPVVERPAVARALAAWQREAARQDGMGMASDVVAGWRPDPLPVGEVQVPARLWYGEADAIGPRHGEWYAARLPRATLTVLPGAGHLLPVANWRRILESALG